MPSRVGDGIAPRVQTVPVQIEAVNFGIDVEDPVHLPMTRADIADYLGLTIETVSRTITALKKDGLICMDEVKGYMTDDAAVKIKVAASLYPFQFRIVRKKGAFWTFTNVGPDEARPGP